MKKNPIVISVSAVSGGGKTTTINELSKRLTSSRIIYFDDYEFEMCSSCSDFNAWNIENLVADIKELLDKNDFDYLLLDYPFAYENKQGAPFIDFTVFIDTPLDIAMARRILRDMIDKPSDLLKDDITSYLSMARNSYLEHIKIVKPKSDLVVDGSLSTDEIVSQILKQISRISAQ
ncbi:MAG: hypothetical protein ACRDD7_14365 [Peptostreptococcaceae bacterium]